MHAYIYIDYDHNIQYATNCRFGKTYDINNYMFYFEIKHRTLIEKNIQWLKEKPWLLLQDKTLPEAIEIITQLGYEDYIK